MESRTPSEKVAQLAASVLESDPALAYIRESSASICYLESDREKTSRGRTVYAECERVPDKYRWAIPYDFSVTVFAPNVARFTDEQMRVLMAHELRHVGIDRDGNEETYRIVPHDVGDFRDIIERYGMDWHGQAGEAEGA